MRTKRLLLLMLIASVLIAYFGFDLGRYLNLETLKAQQSAIESWRAAQPLTAAGLAFVTYIIVTGLSLPGATLMSLAMGAVFGLFWGVILVSFASSIGATLAFLTSRFLLHDWVQQHFGERLQSVHAGIEKDGAFYLFTLRLVPLFPFFMVNLLMGLTPIKTRTYYLATQTGMLAANLVFINAGTQLAKVDSLSAIISPSVLASFALLGLFPWIARRIANAMKQERARLKDKVSAAGAQRNTEN